MAAGTDSHGGLRSERISIFLSILVEEFHRTLERIDDFFHWAHDIHFHRLEARLQCVDFILQLTLFVGVDHLGLEVLRGFVADVCVPSNDLSKFGQLLEGLERGITDGGTVEAEFFELPQVCEMLNAIIRDRGIIET